MSVKAIRSDRPKISEKPFPKLMISANNIVLFTSDCVGTALVRLSEHAHHPGYWSDCWCDVNFTDYHGTVTLENE